MFAVSLVRTFTYGHPPKVVDSNVIKRSAYLDAHLYGYNYSTVVDKDENQPKTFQGNSHKEGTSSSIATTFSKSHEKPLLKSALGFSVNKSSAFCKISRDAKMLKTSNGCNNHTYSVKASAILPRKFLVNNSGSTYYRKMRDTKLSYASSICQDNFGIQAI